MRYEDMLKGVLVRAKGCPEIEAIDAMRNACIEFAEKTYVLTTGSTVTVDGTEVPTYDMTRQVLDIMEARIDGKTVLVTYMNDPAVDALCVGERAITFADPNNAVLQPPATVAAPVTIDLLLVIAPGPESEEVPDWLWLRYSSALQDGALAILLDDDGKPYGNPNKAARHRVAFDDAIRRAAANAGLNRRRKARVLRVTPY